MKKEYIFLFAMGLALCGCTAGERGGRTSLRVADWNVQTFFDARPDGTEYAEFAKSKAWNEEAYTQRLKRLSSVIKKCDAELLVLEEVENEHVVYDLANFLAGDWDKHYAYACFAKEPGSAIGCAVLSRYPLENMSVHALTLRGMSPSVPSLRPLLRVDVCKKGRRLTLFANHWKSKAGGDGSLWRQWQEKVLASRIAEASLTGAVLACGDFNQDIGAFKRGAFRRGEEGETIVLNGLWGTDEMEVRSPWYDAEGTPVEPGSYCFRGEWSRIDGFFSAGTATITSFAPQTQGEWCDAQTHEPRRYQLWNGTGFSDHLPLLCTISF